MPIFGITASSNMSTKLTDFYQIATTTVGSGGASEIVFSSIPQDYTHLQIRGIPRITAAIGDDWTRIQFNSDTGSNYSWHVLAGNGTAASSGNATSQSSMLYISTPGANRTASSFGIGVVDILDYTNTNKFKTIRAISGYDANGTGETHLISGNWRSTNAITSIKVYPTTVNFAQYSSFQLYGIKA